MKYCSRCVQELWPLVDQEVPEAITVMGGEALCHEHMAPPSIDPGNPIIERLARHLRKNFVPGTTDVPWAEASEEERDVWCTEAAHFLSVAQMETLGWSVLPPLPPEVRNHPSVVALPPPPEFVEDVPPSDDFQLLTELPPKWSQPRSD